MHWKGHQEVDCPPCLQAATAPPLCLSTSFYVTRVANTAMGLTSPSRIVPESYVRKSAAANLEAVKLNALLSERMQEKAALVRAPQPGHPPQRAHRPQPAQPAWGVGSRAQPPGRASSTRVRPQFLAPLSPSPWTSGSVRATDADPSKGPSNSSVGRVIVRGSGPKEGPTEPDPGTRASKVARPVLPVRPLRTLDVEGSPDLEQTCGPTPPASSPTSARKRCASPEDVSAAEIGVTDGPLMSDSKGKRSRTLGSTETSTTASVQDRDGSGLTAVTSEQTARRPAAVQSVNDRANAAWAVMHIQASLLASSGPDPASVAVRAQLQTVESTEYLA